MKKAAALVGLLALTASALSVGAAGAEKNKPPVKIQILHFSDWHGQLDPVVVGTSQVGGAAVFSSYFKADRATNPLTLTLTGGDAFGATPPLANFFNEEPAVKALNLMGLNADTLGNHNFDRGIAHLQSMIDLADYDIVSANLANLNANLTGVSPYVIYRLDKVKVAVIGITNEEAPSLVFPGNFGTMVPTDSVAAAMAARQAAREEGAKVFIAIVHKGVTGTDDAGHASGPLIDFANAVTGFDLVLGDHTDVQYSGRHNDALVVEDLSHGEGYSRIQLEVEPTAGRNVLSSSVSFVTPFVASTPGGPDPAVEAMLAPYRAQLSAALGAQIGSSTVRIPRADSCGNSQGRTCESLVGNLVTDAMRTTYGSDFALTNSGGLRAELTCPAAGNSVCPAAAQPPFVITAGQVLTVLPFGNLSVTVPLSGAELKSFLERGVSAMPAVDGRFAQVSGLCFTYDIAAPVGSRVTSVIRQGTGGSCSGAPVDLGAGATYAIATNDFTASGGDGYPIVIGRAVTRNVMEADVRSYVASTSPVTPTLQGRIACADSNGVTAPNCPVTLP
jgi:5'-nucleotidase